MSFVKGEVRVEESEVTKTGGYVFTVQDLQPYREIFDDQKLEVGKTVYFKVDTGAINEGNEPVKMSGVMVSPGRGELETLRELGFRAVAAERGMRVKINGVHLPDSETEMTIQLLEKRELTEEQKAKRQKGADESAIKRRTEQAVAEWEAENKRRANDQQIETIREAEAKRFYAEREARNKTEAPPVQKRTAPQQKAS